MEYQLVQSKPGMSLLDWTLIEASGWIVGTVVDAMTDRPISEAGVLAQFQVTPLPGMGTGIIPQRPRRLKSSLLFRPLSPRLLETDDLGRFILDTVPVATASLTGSHPGYLEDIKDVQIDSAQTQYVELRLVQAQSVSFRVRHRDGQPIPSVSVIRPDGNRASGDQEGLVRFAVLPTDKPAQIKVWAPRYREMALTLESARFPSEIVLDEGLPFFGFVVSEDGNPLEGATVLIHGTDGRQPSYESIVTTDQAGAFSWQLTRPPVWKMHVSQTGYLEKRIGFRGSVDVPYVVRLERAHAAIAGRVTEEDGSPVRHFSLRLRDPFSTDGRRPVLMRSFSHADGIFSMEDLPPGIYQLSAMGEAEDGEFLYGGIDRIYLGHGTIRDVEITMSQRRR